MKEVNEILEKEVSIDWLVIYINVDIGMGCLGVCIKKEFLVVVKVLKVSKFFRWIGIFIYFFIVDEVDIILIKL